MVASGGGWVIQLRRAGVTLQEPPLFVGKICGVVGFCTSRSARDARIDFGKYRGEALGSLPSGYLAWMATKLRRCEQPIWAELAREVLRGRDEGKEPWKIVLERLERTGIGADSGTYAALLRQCGNAKALAEGKRLHAQMIRSGHDRGRFLGNLLLDMFRKCGHLDDARAVFAKMHRRNAFSWGVMIATCSQHGQDKEVLQLFRQMQLEGIVPDEVTVVSILSACASQAALAEGKQIHARIVANGFGSNVIVATALVNMYGKCGSLGDARRWFDEMAVRNVVSWNSIISAYVRHERTKDSLELFQQMQLEGVIPDKVTFLSLLSACASQGFLTEGKQVHARIVDSGFDSDVVVGNAIVNMYAKCGSLEDARRTFDNMPKRDIVSWTSMIDALIQHGHVMNALLLFKQMQLPDSIPDKVIFITILSACSGGAALTDGRWIHACIVDSGFESDVTVGNALVNMYGKCDSLEDARSMFDKMLERNTVSWNAMLTAYAQHLYGEEALQLFRQMQMKDVAPNKITFVTILAACACQSAIAEGKRIHDLIIKNGFEFDVVVGNALVNMYGKCGCLEGARMTFDRMPERNTVSWTTMIAACSRLGNGREALQVFQQMQVEGLIPDKITYISILSACSDKAALVEGKWIHRCIVGSGFELDVEVGNALVDMYGKCGSLKDAWKAFDKMPQQDAVSWTAMITACTQHGHAKDAIELFQQMNLEGVVPDKITFVSLLSACASLASLAEGKRVHAYLVASGMELNVVLGNALVNMYGKCGSLEDAKGAFDKMSEWDVISWNAMIAAFAQHGCGKDALQLFQQMQLEGGIPDNVTYLSILSACASLAATAEGSEIHGGIVNRGFELDVTVGNALVNMYGKCGNLEDAWRLFEKIPEQDVVSWNTMIAAYAQHGCGKEALQLFQQMQLGGLIPNKITFVEILSACSHSGLVDEGCHYFVSMSQDHSVTPTMEHYNCMVDLLGRAGLLDEGEDLIKKLPYEPTAILWMTFLGSCRIHFDMQRVRCAAERVLELNPDDPAPYVLLSNTFAAAGRWGDAVEVRKIMKDKCPKQQPSHNSIDGKNMIYEICEGDELQDRGGRVYA